MKTNDIINLIRSYCVRNNITFTCDDEKLICKTVNNILYNHDLNDIGLVIKNEKTEAKYYDFCSIKFFRTFTPAFKYISVNDLIKLERLETLKELLD
jgi:hypothetical protein